jgi:hypothetical protein
LLYRERYHRHGRAASHEELPSSVKPHEETELL